jgi:hypothetical protein
MLGAEDDDLLLLRIAIVVAQGAKCPRPLRPLRKIKII